MMQQSCLLPFGRDVFLLGALLFELLEGVALERVTRFHCSMPKQDLKFEALRNWFARCLEWDADRRFDAAVRRA